MTNINGRLTKLEAVHAPRGPVRLKTYTTLSTPDDWPTHAPDTRTPEQKGYQTLPMDTNEAVAI